MVILDELAHQLSEAQRWWNARQASRAAEYVAADSDRRAALALHPLREQRLAKAEAKRQRRAALRKIA